MPSNKILTVIIICFGVVTSIYLFQKTSDAPVKNNPTITENIDAVPVNSLDNNQGDDWKKILVSVDSKNQTTSVLTNPEVFDGTTLTAQMSKDFFSQYLLAKQGGKALTTNDINQITNNVMSNPQYSKENGPVYIASNLHVTAKTDLETIKKYK